MPPSDVQPYEVFRRWLLADAALAAEVTNRIYVGGLPDLLQALMPVKAIDVFTVAGNSDRYLRLDRPVFQVECYGPTLADARDVYLKLRAKRREVNSMQAVVGGNAYRFWTDEAMGGIDDIMPVTDWPRVISRWEMVSWEQTA